jgi:Tfp pilus assembly PilM family ATPase
MKTTRLLALEWSETEARLAVASRRGEEVVVEHAFSIPLRPDAAAVDWQGPERTKAEPGGNPASEGGAAEGPAEVGRQIAAALTSRGIRRIDTLVAIGRANIELRQLTLPPAPDDELPEMVRFQALREFNALQEDWPLDFIPIHEDAGEPRNVLAAAIAPELVEQIRRTCHAGGVGLRRLILRPCGAASLFCRRQVEGLPKARLLVDLLADEADLTVMIDRKVIFLRTARLPGDPLADAESAQAILGEIRRTMAAVHNQLGGRRVESIALCGSGPQHAALAEQVAERLGTPAELFDPFAGLKLEGELERGLPEHPGRFAPLLGMLVDELEQASHAVDFLHPRRKPKPPSRIKQYVLAGAAAAVAIVAIVIYGMIEYGRLNDEVADLETQIREWDDLANKVKKIKTTADDIQAWKAGDEVWLDEMRWLSDRLPPAQEAMLTLFQANSSVRGGGEMKIEGLARSVDSIKAMHEKLRDGQHRLVGKEAGEGGSQKEYPLRFSSSVYTGPEPRK